MAKKTDVTKSSKKDTGKDQKKKGKFAMPQSRYALCGFTFT